MQYNIYFYKESAATIPNATHLASSQPVELLVALLFLIT